MLSLANKWYGSPVVLAPMAGITDLPFRSLVSKFGAGLVVTEMVASQDMVQARHGAREKAKLGTHVDTTAVQLAGCDAHWIAEAVRPVADRGAQIIEINMGCPAGKLTRARRPVLTAAPGMVLRLLPEAMQAGDAAGTAENPHAGQAA